MAYIRNLIAANAGNATIQCCPDCNGTGRLTVERSKVMCPGSRAWIRTWNERADCEECRGTGIPWLPEDVANDVAEAVYGVLPAAMPDEIAQRIKQDAKRWIRTWIE